MVQPPIYEGRRGSGRKAPAARRRAASRDRSPRRCDRPSRPRTFSAQGSMKEARHRAHRRQEVLAAQGHFGLRARGPGAEAEGRGNDGSGKRHRLDRVGHVFPPLGSPHIRPAAVDPLICKRSARRGPRRMRPRRPPAPVPRSSLNHRIEICHPFSGAPNPRAARRRAPCPQTARDRSAGDGQTGETGTVPGSHRGARWRA